MLFIGYNQCQILKFHLILQQRMRADHDINLTLLNFFVDSPLLLEWCRANKACCADVIMRKLLRQLLVMLSRKHLRRCHERTLIPSLRTGKQSCSRNDRLSRSNISLDQAVHHTIATHIC